MKRTPKQENPKTSKPQLRSKIIDNISDFLWNNLQILKLTPQIAPGNQIDELRYRRASLSSIANIFELATTVLLSIAGIALTLPYLGKDRMGIWLTIASFTSLLSFLDFGLGNAMVGRVAMAANTSPALLSRVVVGGLGLIIFLAISVSAALFVIAAAAPWQSIIVMKNAALLLETRHSAEVFAVLFGIFLVTGSMRKIFQGLQRAYLSSLAVIGANVCALGALVIAAHIHAGAPLLLLITFGFTAAAPLILLPVLAEHVINPWRTAMLSIREESRFLLSTGGLFLVIQIGTLINTSSDALIIASVLGPVTVSLYTVAQKPFQFCSLPARVLSGALWPTYADAYHRNDRAFIRKTLFHQLKIAALSVTAATGILVFIHNDLVAVWTNHKISVPFALTTALALWTISEGIALPFAAYMNGCGKIRPQVGASVFLVFTLLPAKIFALRYWGLSGMVFTAVVFFLLVQVLFYFVLFPKEALEPLKPSASAADLNRDPERQ